MKINNFRGELTDIPAKKEVVTTMCADTILLRRFRGIGIGSVLCHAHYADKAR